ncbi:MAG: acyltransferase [Parabacteroides sp.]|nr:acyltransferase [Parabacteroides sp.]
MRILAMSQIILWHFTGWGTSWRLSTDYINDVTFSNGYILNSLLYSLLTTVGSLGVDSFVLISGYFLCASSILRFDKLLDIWLQTLFYSVGLATIFFFTTSDVTIIDLVKSALPIVTTQYWFVTKYVGLLVLAPFLAKLSMSLPKKSFEVLLVVMFFLTCSIIQFFPLGIAYTNGRGSYSLLLFVYLFLIAAYIRKYDISSHISRWMGLVSFVLVMVQAIGGVLISLKDQHNVISSGFSVSNNALTMFSSIAVFIYVKSKNINNRKLIGGLTKVAPNIFGVYLIHDNAYVRTLLWRDIISPAKYWGSPVYLLLAMCVPFVILAVCISIDYLRSYLFKMLRIYRISEYLLKRNIEI